MSAIVLKAIVCPPDDNYDEETVAVVKVSGEGSLYDVGGEVVVDEETDKGVLVFWKDYAIALVEAIQAALKEDDHA